MTAKTMSDYKEDHDYSERPEIQKLFNDFYKRELKTVAIEKVDDKKRQKLGIDKIITLKSGQTINIDEKARRKYYDDILAEIISATCNDYFESADKEMIYVQYNGKKQKGTIGWTLNKTYITDFVAYMKPGVIELIHYKALREFVTENLDRLIEQYKLLPNHNDTYVSLSIGIPKYELEGIYRTFEVKGLLEKKREERNNNLLTQELFDMIGK